VLLNRFAIAQSLSHTLKHKQMPWETKEEAQPRLDEINQEQAQRAQLYNDKDLLMKFCGFVERDQLRSFYSTYHVLCHDNDNQAFNKHNFRYTFDKEAFLSHVSDGERVVQRLYNSQYAVFAPSWNDGNDGGGEFKIMIPKWTEDIYPKWTRCGVMAQHPRVSKNCNEICGLRYCFGLFDSENNELTSVSVAYGRG
jgi:hypothetical protein